MKRQTSEPGHQPAPIRRDECVIYPIQPYELDALRSVAAKYAGNWTMHSHASRCITLVAFNHWKVFERWLVADVNYCWAEDIEDQVGWWVECARLLLKRKDLIRHDRYRRGRRQYPE